MKVDLKPCWIWSDRYFLHYTGYNEAFADQISWRLAFADCHFSKFCQTIRQKCLVYWLFRWKGLFEKQFYVNAMWFYETEIIFVDFLRFVDISFHFVYIPRCVTHSVQRAPVKISFHTSVLICKAETSVLVNEITVLSCSITGFSIWNIPRSILGG